MDMRANKLNFRMRSHFSRIADAYRAVRTTDVEPIFFIKEKLQECDGLIGADIGCGAGRYDRLLLDHLPFSHLLCLDVNFDMVKQTQRFLCETQVGGVGTSLSMAELLPVKRHSLDCAFSFNAVHHFVPEAFLREIGAALKESGRLFLYTRLPEHNEESIWGRYFPGFIEKETRLHGLESMKREIEMQTDLELEEVKCFCYLRVANLEKLISQVQEKHYSTFSLYTPQELRDAVNGFKSNILSTFSDPGHLEWTDGNVMLVIRRPHSNLHIAKD